MSVRVRVKATGEREGEDEAELDRAWWISVLVLVLVPCWLVLEALSSRCQVASQSALARMKNLPAFACPLFYSPTLTR